MAAHRGSRMLTQLQTMKTQLLKLNPRHKWFQACNREAESWAGPFETMEAAIADAVTEQTECGDAVGVIWIAQGRPSTKAEREEFGTDWKWWVEAANAFPIQLTAKPTDHKAVQWDYGTWVEQLREVNHLSETQLARLGVLIAHRLRYRSVPELAKMIHEVAKELRNQVEADADLPIKIPT